METFRIKHRFTLLLLLVSFSGAGCNTPTGRALNQGDYERAVRLSVDKLRSSPNNKKAAEVLERALAAGR